METTVIELNQAKALTTYANGDYVAPVTDRIDMVDGDRLNLRMASIDKPSGIVIPEDLPVSISFSYYDMDYDKTSKYELATSSGAPTTTWPDATYDMYAMYDDVRILQLTSLSYTCPNFKNPQVPPPFPGSPGNQVMVSPLLAWIDPSGIHHHQTGKYPFPDNEYQYSGVASGQDGAGIAVCTTFIPEIQPIIYKEGSLTIVGVNVMEGPLFPNQPAPSSSVRFNQGSIAFTVKSAGKRDLKIATVGAIIPPGRYDDGTLAVTLSTAFNEVPIDPTIQGVDQFFSPASALLIRTDQVAVESSVFSQVPATKETDVSFNTSNTYQYWTGTAIPKVCVGAVKFAVEYGVNGNNYQLTAHTSVYNSASPGKENIAFYTSGTTGIDLRWHEMRSSTGIVIHDMQPTSFWEDILALRSNVIVPLTLDANDVSYYTQLDVQGKLSLESSTLPTFMPDNNRFITDPPATLPVYIDTTETPVRAIVGNTPTVNAIRGWYLVEITGLNVAQSRYIDATGTRLYISGIVSTQYDSNDLVTGFQESSIEYVHRGVPLKITSARVRILDPITKEVVTTIGPNNTIWLQVDHEIPQQVLEEKSKALAGTNGRPKVTDNA